MLVLTRKRNESILIDGKIKLKVVEIRGDKVRIGIDAPKHVTLFRQEVLEAIAKKQGGQPVPDQS
jgi:carbon storage regulator